MTEVYAFHDMEVVPVPVKKETEKMFFFDGCIKELGYVSKLLKENAFTSKDALIAHEKKVLTFHVKHFNRMLTDARKQLNVLKELEELG